MKKSLAAAFRLALTLALVWLAVGCAAPRDGAVQRRPFVFGQDTFAYENELAWEYRIDPATGKTTTARREPPPTYSLHCYVVSRSARQFLQHARFDPQAPVADAATYRRLVRRVIDRSPRRECAESERVVIPGYANLREFSQAWEGVVKDGCGGAWQSYLQRGNWRMIFPVSRRHQRRTAAALAESLRTNRPPVVHLFRFPSLRINHAVLLFGVTERAGELRFDVYDPNEPDTPTSLVFRESDATFHFPPGRYFAGGPVKVYEIYQSALY